MSRTHTDLSIVAVSVAPSPATSGTSLGVTDANAAFLPDVYPWYALVKPASSMPTRSNGEIVQVTGGSSSAGTTTYTIVRAQGVPVTTARSIIVGDEILEVHAAQHQANIDATQNSSMSRQALINGNFDVWQRGTTLTPTDATTTYTADRWVDALTKDGGTLPTLTRSRQSITAGELDKSFFFSRLATNGAGTSLGVSSYHQYSQGIENGTRYLCGNGKKVTVSFWAKSDIANKRIGISLSQNYGSGGSPTTVEHITGDVFTLTSSWAKYTYTFTTNTLTGKTFGTANDDKLSPKIWVMWGTTIGNEQLKASVTAETYVGSGNIDIAQVQLCAGDVALPFQPKSFEEELRACQRYYEKAFNYGTTPAASTQFSDYTPIYIQGDAAGNAWDGNTPFWVPFRVNKRSTSGTLTTYDATTSTTSLTAAKVIYATFATPSTLVSGTAGNSITVFDNRFVGFGNYTGTGSGTVRRVSILWTYDCEL